MVGTSASCRAILGRRRRPLLGRVRGCRGGALRSVLLDILVVGVVLLVAPD